VIAFPSWDADRGQQICLEAGTQRQAEQTGSQVSKHAGSQAAN